jgi:hypothetical protein
MKDWPSLFRAVAKFGVPSVLAGYLIWVMVADNKAQLKSIEEALRGHQLDTSYYVKSVDELKIRTDRTNLILQQICVNGSSPRDRPNCFR